MNETSWHSYPSIYSLGHRAIKDLLQDPVTIEEKVDGSQFSFGLFPANDEYAAGYRARSKGAQLNMEAPEKMFKIACETITTLPLREGWTYRAEYLLKPKHNVLSYDRIPKNHLIVFDINPGHEEYLSAEHKEEEACRIGLETVPAFHNGIIENIDKFRELLENTSCLGGQKIEGIVIKNYNRFGLDKKILMGKFVSEAFKEVHAGEWRKANPVSSDIIQELILKYKTPARWQKAVQHLKEVGKIEQSPRDIGLLIKEAQEDIKKECQEEIAEYLVKYAMPKVLRGAVAGLPEWYKEELVKIQFS